MFSNLQQLYNKYPWKSEKKFVPLAKKHGFKEKEAKEFIKKIVHDKRIKIKPVYLPIYSESGDSYQFDTFIQRNGTDFLVFININTRKAYAYPMKNKGTSEVINALDKFFNEVKGVKVLRSDQDSAYLSNQTLEYLRTKGVRYLTTEDENHNVLGIINRFMRTIRDLNGSGNITESKMKELIELYNNSVHSSTGIEPNEMNKQYERKYIEQKRIETQNRTRAYDFKPGDRVRIIIEPEALKKKRSNLTPEAYIVMERSGNMFLIGAKDHSVDYYPGYKLMLCSKDIPLADTLKNQKRGVVDEIISYDEKKDKYKVIYEGGVKDIIPAKNLREGEPLKLSSMERAYWVRTLRPHGDRVSLHKELPSKIKKYV